jgi:SAM-dependent MidA family methyltransferase
VTVEALSAPNNATNVAVNGLGGLGRTQHRFACEGSGVAFRSWRAAIADALYGPRGFYRDPGAPGRHFRTAAHTSPLWARAWLTLAERVYGALPAESRAEFAIVDMGAGGGELIDALATMAPESWRLVGVDVAPRPADLADRVEWSAAPPTDTVGLIAAVEWLDVVPVDVAERAADGVRLVEVDGGGDERLGPALPAADAEWLERWWSLTEVGNRAEIGRPRDEAWRDLVGCLRGGLAVAVDYAAVPARHIGGTLTGYRDGRQVQPVPDGSTDITAHVHFPSCAGTVMTQRDALRGLGIDGRVPPYGDNPAAYARALQHASDAAELLDPDGLGGFGWLIESRGVALKDCFA